MDSYIGKEELASRFNIPVSTVDCLRRQGKIPSFKVGKHNRFNLKEVEKSLRKKDN